MTKFENNIGKKNKTIYLFFFMFCVFPWINEISIKFYLVIRISNLKKKLMVLQIYMFELWIIISFKKKLHGNLITNNIFT